MNILRKQNIPVNKTRRAKDSIENMKDSGNSANATDQGDSAAAADPTNSAVDDEVEILEIESEKEQKMGKYKRKRSKCCHTIMSTFS